MTGRNIPGINEQIVPPPPSLAGGTAASARGLGNAGHGLGTPLDLGSPASPAGAGGTSATPAVVVSSQPGARVGVPATGGTGSLALSPAGGPTPGLGGSGGGSGIGTGGNGPGAAKEGTGPGSGKSGTGVGADSSARTGISPAPGPGGAGTGSRGGPTTPGISVQGGGIITLPSFGSSGGDPNAAARSRLGQGAHGPSVTVVATSRSGGAFNFYGALKGDKVYTIYVPTILGTAVLQFSDPASSVKSYSGDLTAPEPLRTDLPITIDHSRLVIACVIDHNGELQRLRILDGASSPLAAKVVPALMAWKFRPVLRGEQPIEADAILGFNIDTR